MENNQILNSVEILKKLSFDGIKTANEFEGSEPAKSFYKFCVDVYE